MAGPQVQCHFQFLFRHWPQSFIWVSFPCSLSQTIGKFILDSLGLLPLLGLLHLTYRPWFSRLVSLFLRIMLVYLLLQASEIPLLFSNTWLNIVGTYALTQDVALLKCLPVSTVCCVFCNSETSCSDSKCFFWVSLKKFPALVQRFQLQPFLTQTLPW